MATTSRTHGHPPTATRRVTLVSVPKPACLNAPFRVQSFVYLLCQVTLRAVVTKVYNFGIRPSLQKILLDDSNAFFGLTPPKDD